MPLTFTFIGATPNRAVYKITSVSGGSGVITNEGAATPDLSTDIPANTPIGAYLRTAVATDAAGQTLIHYNTRFKAVVRGSTSILNSDTSYFTIQARQSATSGLAELVVNSQSVVAANAPEGVLELELYHTIAK